MLQLIQAGVMVYSYAYHRHLARVAQMPKTAADRIIGPVLTEGGPIPMLYGRCRVRSPIIAWYGNLTAEQSTYTTGLYIYEGDFLFMLGLTFDSSNTKLQGIFVGDNRVENAGTPNNLAPNLGASPMPNVVANLPSDSPEFTQIFYEFSDGAETQNLLAGVGSHTAARMVAAGIDEDDIPGYRGMAMVLCRISRNAPNLPAISFEVSTYPSPLVLSTPQIGLDANPADVIYDLITNKRGKLGLETSVDSEFVDSSFITAAQTLTAEGHGYSRAIEEGATATELIDEILRQIDGVLQEDRKTGKIKLKLIRPDFDPRTIPQINPDNCEAIEDFAAGGWTSTTNKIRLLYTDRLNNYQEGSATAHSQANAVGQDGQVRELVISMPGIHTAALAEVVAARELAALSRPLAKCRAVVDRTFWNVLQGDAVSLSWPEYNISSMVFRVAAVDLGPPDSHTIRLELLQDFFYVHRSTLGVEESVAPFPGSGGLLVF